MTANLLFRLAQLIYAFASYMKHGHTPNLVIFMGTTVIENGEKAYVPPEMADNAAAYLREHLDAYLKDHLDLERK